MSETKWQPGPWHRNGWDKSLRDTNGARVLFTRLALLSGSSSDAPTYEANTTLADAAPELYAALADLLAVADAEGLDEATRARNALAAAKGETP